MKNFKSIKDLTIDCKRINLFVGEPNTGKSNILEALGLLSWLAYAKVAPEKKEQPDASKFVNLPQPYYPRLFDFIRFLGVQDIFHDGLIDDKVELSSTRKKRETGIELKLAGNSFLIDQKVENTGKKTRASKAIRLNFSGDVTEALSPIDDFSLIKSYKFLKQQFYFPHNTTSFLLPPFGSNLFSLVMGNKRLREIMMRFYQESDLTLVLKPQNMAFEIQVKKEDLVFSYPYISLSDTLQRILFHLIAIESNEKSTLVFEEPESYAFPYFTKYLGERIAMNDSNQYFISTHNPYLLQSILEKADKNSINVFVTYLENSQTKTVLLTGSQISELLDSADPFFNLDVFIERNN
jgi:AAA15 family ATPase/GTPase